MMKRLLRTGRLLAVIYVLSIMLMAATALILILMFLLFGGASDDVFIPLMVSLVISTMCFILSRRAMKIEKGDYYEYDSSD